MTVKSWYVIHKWSSLVCTLFLLILCVTGLPLIFHEEIEHWLDDALPYAVVPEGTPRASMDQMLATTYRMYPNEAVEFVFVDDEEPQVLIGLTPDRNNEALGHRIRFDAYTGQVLKEFGPTSQDGHSFMDVMHASACRSIRRSSG